MKISRNWLQTYFDTPLPDARELSDALTFHTFEIESIEDDVLDVKVTPNRGHDCLSHRGIAKELSAILELPMKNDSLRVPLPALPEGVAMEIESPARAPVGAVAYVRGVKIGASPMWLKERLESIGQRSINNVVDATNYVMFDIGMPTHAFSADTFKDGGIVRYGIRCSKKSEKLALLGGTAIELSGDEAVIVNASDEAVDIGGVKGGMRAELQENTTEVLLSASKFEPVQTRRAAQRFNQRTEAAKRFENEMSDELAVYGVRAVADLVQKIAGGEIVGYGIVKSRSSADRTVSVSLAKINTVLGTRLEEKNVADVLKRLDLQFKCNEMSSHCIFDVEVPFERMDITIPEDLIEEIGRIIGYDSSPAVELPVFRGTVEINENFYASEKVREDLISGGYSEVFTSVFADKGERAVLNKVGGERPFLRSTLIDGLKDALEKNTHNKDLLGLEGVKLFEIGTVWSDGKEIIMVGTVSEKERATEKPLEEYLSNDVSCMQYDDLPFSAAMRYQSFSKYPYIVRDIAMWVPTGTGADEVLEIIKQNAGELLVRSSLFDRFEKGGKTSLAFRLVFQSFGKTLTDEDVNQVMSKVYAVLMAQGFEIR